MLIINLFAFVMLALLSCLLVFLLRRWLQKLAVLDLPNERSSHSIATPRGGGIAMVVLTLLSAIIFSIITGQWQKSLVFMAGGSAMALLGWRDDVKSLPARVRLVVQGLVALATLAGLGYFQVLPFPFIGEIPLGVVGILVTVVWIVGMANAYNFMDGIDGIAGGVAVAGGLGWMTLILAGADSLNGLAFYLALAIAATSLGFLVHNWSPARIFMGDVGSVFLGYSFAVIPLLVENKGSQPFMLAVLVMWTFIMDAGITFIRRFLRKESLFSPHRSHLYQRMVIAGSRHASVSLFYVLLTGIGVGLGLGWLNASPLAHGLILFGLPFIWLVLRYLAGNLSRWQAFTNFPHLVREMGASWVFFRIRYAIRKKMGWLRMAAPAYTWEQATLSTLVKTGIPIDPEQYTQYRLKHAPPWFFNDLPVFPTEIPWNPEYACKNAERVLAGEWKYFSHDWRKTGFPPVWNVDPLSGITLDASKHWSKIPEQGEFEIKYIWESSRFSMVFTLMRAFAAKHEDRYAEAFWHLIEDWMEKNPPGMGANWQNGQEAALRLIAVCFGYFAFRNAESCTSHRVVLLTCLAAALGRRIHQDIDFAIYTRGNHAITESFGLWLCGLVFPELKEADRYRAEGRRILEEQAGQQLLNDGGYSMYSINYHRFVLHILSLAIRLGELNQQRFSDGLYEKMGKSANFLCQLLETMNGHVPNYGSNDGALVLPLNNCDFSDYRPVVQLVHFITHRKRLFPPGEWDEDLYWLVGESALQASQEASPLQMNASFPDAGVYVIQAEKSKAVLRCTDFHFRPSHADQLHMDLWWQDENVACDAGTYLYHGQGLWRNGLASTAVHNTVCVDDSDQMVHLGIFTWVAYAKARIIQNGLLDGVQVWQGQQGGYQRLNDSVLHTRSVFAPGQDRWLVLDQLESQQPHLFALQWLLADLPVEELIGRHSVRIKVGGQWLKMEFCVLDGTGEFSLTRGAENSTRGWRSLYYGEKLPALSAVLSTRSVGTTFFTTFLPEGIAPITPDQVRAWLKKLK